MTTESFGDISVEKITNTLSALSKEIDGMVDRATNNGNEAILTLIASVTQTNTGQEVNLPGEINV